MSNAPPPPPSPVLVVDDHAGTCAGLVGLSDHVWELGEIVALPD